MIHLLEAGHSYKVYGLKGELSVDIHLQYLKHILKSNVVFFVIQGNAVPFFIESIRGSDDLFIKFKEVDSPEAARELSNQIVYIDDKDLVVEEIIEEEDISELDSLLHFQMEDVVSGFKGTIKGIEEFPSQLMALVEKDSKEYMIPIHEDWIVDLDRDKKLIRLKLPEGLLDL